MTDPKEHIDPQDQIPFDDLEFADKEDQQSQNDVHSNGLTEEFITPPESDDPPIDLLEQSYKATESAHILDLGRTDLPPNRKA